MPRQPRYFVPGFPQHVIQRGVNRQAVFFEPRDYRLYLDTLCHAAADHDCSIHAYVLMTNHTHLLVTPGTEQSLPLLMQAMGRGYVQKLNRRRGRTGTLWQGRYKASLVQDDRYLLTCYRYIELNPVRAGLVSDPAAYPYSSYRHNALGATDTVLTGHSTYRALAPTTEQRLATYRALFADEISADTLTLVRNSANACRILGSERFKDRIESMVGRSVRPGRPGRPRKKPA